MNSIWDDHFPDDAQVVVTWNESSRAAAPIRIQIGQFRALLPPNTPTIAAATVGKFLVDETDFDVSVQEIAEEADEEPEAEAQAKEADKPGGGKKTPAQAS